MGSRRKTGGDRLRPPALTRRSVITAASVAPMAASVGVAAQADDAVARCTAFLAVDIEIDRLALRWSQLESLMAREGRWFGIPQAERLAQPEVREMAQIDRQMHTLFRRRKRMLALIPTTRATDVNGVAAKIAVAAKVLSPDENPLMHRLLDGALRELTGLHCLDCDAPLVIGGAI